MEQPVHQQHGRQHRPRLHDPVGHAPRVGDEQQSVADGSGSEVAGAGMRPSKSVRRRAGATAHPPTALLRRLAWTPLPLYQFHPLANLLIDMTTQLTVTSAWRALTAASMEAAAAPAPCPAGAVRRAGLPADPARTAPPSDISQTVLRSVSDLLLSLDGRYACAKPLRVQNSQHPRCPARVRPPCCTCELC